MTYKNDNVRFEITEHIGVLSTDRSGWTKEVNLVSWNGSPPKYDIREWDPKHEKMSRGVTLSEDEASRIRQILGERELGERELERKSGRAARKEKETER